MKKYVFISLFIILTVCLCVLNPFTKNNTLYGISVIKNADGYELSVRTDDYAPFKKKTESQNSVYFEFANLTPDNPVDTFYHDASGIEGVIVQQISKNKTRVYLRGENVSEARASFDIKGKIHEMIYPANTDFSFLAFVGSILGVFVMIKVLFANVKNEPKLNYEKALVARQQMKEKMYTEEQNLNRVVTNPYYTQKKFIQRGTTIKILEEKREQEFYGKIQKSA